MATTFGLTPKQRRQRGTATQEQELRADPYHARQRGATAGLLADIPGSIPDLLNIGADYFYSGLNSLLDVGDLSPYDIPRSLGIHPSQRQPIGPTSEQLEQSLTGAGLLSPTTGTPEETVSRVATGFAEGAPVAALGAITRQSPAFFSGLLSAAQKLPAKGTTQQMTKGLLKGGAKEAEIKEIGLDTWLSQDSPIDDDPTAYRDNIVGFIEDNQLKLHETEKRGRSTQFGEYTEDGGENYKELVLQIDSRSQYTQARRKFENFIDKLTSKSDQPSFSALDFELEVLRRRHPRGGSASAMPYIKTDEISESEFEIGTNLLDDIDAARIRDRRVTQSNLPDLPASETHLDTGTGSSWDNQIAHVRFNERIGADGDDILFLEELQSDWSNAGLKHGFETTKQGLVDRVINEAVEGGLTRDQATAAVNAQLADPSNVLRVYDDDGGRLDTLDEALGKLSKYDDQRLPLNTLFHDLHGKPMDTLARPPGSVPDAPFVKNPNQWARLALGRMLRYAADKGFDKLAWTTGETQAKRWRELREIRSIGYTPSSSDHYVSTYGYSDDAEMYHIVGYDAEGHTTLVERMSAEEVEKKLGADALEHFRTKPLDGDSGRIEVDLKIGGEKKKRLYDQVYPNVVKKLVKKMGGVVKRETIGEPNRFDGAKVVEVRDASNSPQYAIEMPDGALATKDDVFPNREDAFGTPRTNPSYIIENRAAQQHNLDELLKVRPLEAWTVTIPRGWKKKIKEGLPLFSVPAAGLLGAQASEDQ